MNDLSRNSRMYLYIGLSPELPREMEVPSEYKGLLIYVSVEKQKNNYLSSESILREKSSNPVTLTRFPLRKKVGVP